MIQLVGSAPLIALMLLLVAFGTASAECAWVLWHGVGRNPTWQRLDVFDKRSACIEVLDQKQQKQGLQAAHRASETSLWVVLGEAAWEDTCLPDTVDPRGLKAK